MSKTQDLSRHKKSIKREEYINQLEWSDARTIIRLRIRMTKLKNNYKKGVSNTECPRCHTGIDDEQHLLTACPAVNRQNIQDIQLEDIYTLPINRDKLKRLAKFVTQYEDSK